MIEVNDSPCVLVEDKVEDLEAWVCCEVMTGHYHKWGLGGWVDRPFAGIGHDLRSFAFGYSWV